MGDSEGTARVLSDAHEEFTNSSRCISPTQPVKSSCVRDMPGPRPRSRSAFTVLHGQSDCSLPRRGTFPRSSRDFPADHQTLHYEHGPFPATPGRNPNDDGPSPSPRAPFPVASNCLQVVAGSLQDVPGGCPRPRTRFARDAAVIRAPCSGPRSPCGALPPSFGRPPYVATTTTGSETTGDPPTTGRPTRILPHLRQALQVHVRAHVPPRTALDAPRRAALASLSPSANERAADA